MFPWRIMPPKTSVNSIAKGKDDQIHSNRSQNKKNIIGDEERMTLIVINKREYGGSDNTSTLSQGSNVSQSGSHSHSRSNSNSCQLLQTLKESSQGGITIIFNSQISISEHVKYLQFYDSMEIAFT